MNIAIICYPTFGGSGVVATELGLVLAKRGHQVHFITYNQPVRLDFINRNLHFHQVNIEEYPLFQYQPYELALSSKIVNVVKEHHIDILHVHYAIPHAYAGYMAKQMLLSEGISVPMMTTLHGTDITLVGSHPYYQTAVEFSINMSECVTCVSESLRQDTLRLFKVNKPIEVIPNFINLQEHQLSNIQCKKMMIAPQGQKIISHISNFRKVKRIKDVISIFYRIQQKIDSLLIMVGEGPEKESAERQCERLNISDKVIFMGNSSDVDKILSLSDLFLLPSLTESFGLSALEAMASGVPVISSDTGGLPEVNISGVSGYLSPVGDVEKMASDAIFILEDEYRLKTFKQQAKKNAQRFDEELIVPMYEKLYTKLKC